MLLSSLELVGLPHGADHSLEDLGPEVVLPAAPAGVAIADGLTLLQFGLDPDAAPDALERLGLAGTAVEVLRDDQGRLDQVAGLDAHGVEALVGEERSAVIGARFQLDPVLYGHLREQSQRDPRVVTALGQDPSLGIRVGWLFTADRTVASVTVLDLQVGDVGFPLTGSERPPWIDPMLRAVARRLDRPDPERLLVAVATDLEAASQAADPARRAAWRRLAATLEGAPFGLGRAEVVRTGRGVEVAFGEDLVRARQLGPVAARALRLAHAALVRAPDVLVVEEPVLGPHRDWLVSLISGDDATLEQVILVPPPEVA